MFKASRCRAIAVGVIGVAATFSAVGQTYAPYGQGLMPGYGSPTGSYGEPYGYGAPPSQPQQGFRIIRDADPTAYYILVSTGGIEPQAVQVRAEGRWLLIGLDRSKQDTTQQQFDEGRGYVRSYSFSSGQTNRRFTLPQDADLQGMKREDGDKEVRITIPRHQP